MFLRYRAGLLIALAMAGASLCLQVQAQNNATAANAGGRSWASLSPAQQTVLQPLQREWNNIHPSRKSKWLEVANRYATYPPAEQARIQGRMAEWARLSPQERGEARLNFKEVQQISPEDRKAKWEAYNALPPEQRQELAARAVPASAPGGRLKAAPVSPAKVNTVPGGAITPPRPQVVAPTVAQAQPGATTNLVTLRPSPPAHQQTGAPKIVTNASMVNNTTLLPKAKERPAGPSATASAPAGERP